MSNWRWQNYHSSAGMLPIGTFPFLDCLDVKPHSRFSTLAGSEAKPHAGFPILDGLEAKPHTRFSILEHSDAKPHMRFYTLFYYQIEKKARKNGPLQKFFCKGAVLLMSFAVFLGINL